MFLSIQLVQQSKVSKSRYTPIQPGLNVKIQEFNYPARFKQLHLLDSFLHIVPRLSINAGRKIEPGSKPLRKRQVLHTFRVNRNLQDIWAVYMSSGTSETNSCTKVVWWFAVWVRVCGAGVIPPKLKTHLSCKSSSVNTLSVIDLTVS